MKDKTLERDTPKRCHESPQPRTSLKTDAFVASPGADTVVTEENSDGAGEPKPWFSHLQLQWSTSDPANATVRSPNTQRSLGDSQEQTNASTPRTSLEERGTFSVGFLAGFVCKSFLHPLRPPKPHWRPGKQADLPGATVHGDCVVDS